MTYGWHELNDYWTYWLIGPLVVGHCGVLNNYWSYVVLPQTK